MVRKRVSFRPNIAASSAQSQQTQEETTDKSSAAPEPLETSTPTSQTTTEVVIPENVVSNEGVAEAIAQLTGHKFEPVRLSSLNSVNRNIKLKDLLFFNPPLTKDQKRHKKIESKRRKKQIDEERTRNQKLSSRSQEQPVDCSQDAADSSEHEPSLIPQVKMGPDGRLILDESSTVINRTNAIKSQDAILEDSEDVISKTNYDSFRRRPSATNQSKWSPGDTQKFYNALSFLGTDFSLMESLFFSGHRSRTELHKKFKREERLNKCKVDIALSKRISVDEEELEDLKEVFCKE